LANELADFSLRFCLLQPGLIDLGPMDKPSMQEQRGGVILNLATPPSRLNNERRYLLF
jgi:hypothetical protein